MALSRPRAGFDSPMGKANSSSFPFFFFAHDYPNVTYCTVEWPSGHKTGRWPSGLRRQFKALVFGRGFESRPPQTDFCFHTSSDLFFPLHLDRTKFGRAADLDLAQLVERVTVAVLSCNHNVTGSIPVVEKSFPIVTFVERKTYCSSVLNDSTPA